MIYGIVVPMRKKRDGKWDKPPSLNEYIKSERTTIYTRNGKFMTKGGALKKEWQKYFSIYIIKCLPNVKITKPIIVHYRYFYPDYRMDCGNIHCPIQKYMEDALQDCGVILNDNQRYIKGFTADFSIDKVAPRIEVDLEVLENEFS